MELSGLCIYFTIEGGVRVSMATKSGDFTVECFNLAALDNSSFKPKTPYFFYEIDVNDEKSRNEVYAIAKSLSFRTPEHLKFERMMAICEKTNDK